MIFTIDRKGNFSRGFPVGEQGDIVNGWWQEICTMVVSEFSDLPTLAEFTRITLRLVIAATLGGLLGLEGAKRQGSGSSDAYACCRGRRALCPGSSADANVR